MSVIRQLQKFAAAERVLRFEIGGNVFWNEVLSSTTPRMIADRISNALLQNGWGVRDIESSWTPFNLSPRLYVYVYADINAPLNENPERVRQGVQAVATSFLDNLSVTLTNDSLYNQGPNGGVVVSPTNQLDPAYAQPSVWEQIFGKETSLTDAGGKVLGLSVSTLVIAGIVYVVATSKKRR